MSAATMLSKEHFDAFLSLTSRLSPENLSCDGELSQAEQDAAAAKINTEWKALEKTAGCGRITVDDIEQEHYSRMRSGQGRRFGR